MFGFRAVGVWLVVGVFCCVSAGATAQVGGRPDSDSANSTSLPDAPESRQGIATKAEAESDGGKQTKRILGVVPNFRSVSANVHLPPQSSREKFVSVVQDSFDYSSFIFIGLLSGVSQLEGSTPEFHTGPPAYARYYWHNFADQTDENLWVGYVIPSALHQDARFYTLGPGSRRKRNSAVKRAGYAFSRILVTRTDSGGSAFNFSEVVGAGAAAGISNLYYPGSNRTWTKTGQRWVLNVGIDGGTFIFKEFWPDLNRAIFHNK
jgi:hypothetical protein